MRRVQFIPKSISPFYFFWVYFCLCSFLFGSSPPSTAVSPHSASVSSLLTLAVDSARLPSRHMSSHLKHVRKQSVGGWLLTRSSGAQSGAPGRGLDLRQSDRDANGRRQRWALGFSALSGLQWSCKQNNRRFSAERQAFYHLDTHPVWTSVIRASLWAAVGTLIH